MSANSLQFSAGLGTILASLVSQLGLDPQILADLSAHDDDVTTWAGNQPNIVAAGAGSGTWTASTQLSVTVTFPTPFPTQPVVTVTPGIVPAPGPPTCAMAMVSATGFTVQFNTPTNMANGTVQVFSWNAVGAQTAIGGQ